MSPPHSHTASPTPSRMTVVDILAEGQPAALSVHWPAAGPSPRPIETATIEPLRRQLEALYQAEQDHRDAEVPAARRALGQTLWDVLDGPERRLTRALADADSHGEALDLVIRLRVKDEPGSLADHPATLWRWELLSPTTGGHPTTDGRIRLVVQMGAVEPSPAPRVLEHGGLRIVFMAYSPLGVQPLLDYEAEEERLLEALERPIRDSRVRVQVVEDGTLAELERRLREGPADVVHLTGHGKLTSDGPRLVMEDELGRPDAINPRDLLRVLKRAAKKPDLVVISSCHSAEGRDGTPSFAAALVAGGMPAVLGWVQPVRDDVATRAAADLYGRLCGGDTPAQAVAFIREQLREADRGEKFPSHAWGTLHLLMRDARGFRVETQGTQPLPKTSMGGEALYRYLGATGGMRVLERGFIGRRRPLQRLLRILRTGRDEDGALVAGAAVLGMKGVGKSCLLGRVLERHSQDSGSTGVVVLHGVLDDVMVLQQLLEAAHKRRDDEAEGILMRGEPVPQRVHRLLTGHWADEPIVVVLDDFEQNLELRDDGDARPTAQAAALLEVLLPACQANRPKLMVTTTASFSKPSGRERSLAEVALGSFEPPMLRKLWTRMPEEDREKVSLPAWKELGERLGRNPRVLDWARALLRGKTPEEVEAVVRKVGEGEVIPQWKGDAGPSEERVAELARLFLRTLAIDEARERLSEDALTFVRRARVYEWPVPKEAFEGLLDGLAIDLDRDVTVLQNLGMFEVGEMDGKRAHRVSPLVEPDFDVEDPERWHAVAAAFWERASEGEHIEDRFARVVRAWEHALAGQCENVADRCGRRINVAMHGRGLNRANRALAARHVRAFPESTEGLLWAGSTEEQIGNMNEGWLLYEQGESLALARGVAGSDRCRIIREGSVILRKLGRYEEAEQRLVAVVDALRHATDRALYADALSSLAGVQHMRGRLPEARSNINAAVAIKIEVHGTEEHPSVAASIHELARVCLAQGDLSGAQSRIERSLVILKNVHGTEEHPDVSASHHELARVLSARGDFVGARASFEQSLAIKVKVHGTQEHPDIAASLHHLAGVLLAQGDLSGARVHLERSYCILVKVHGTEVHPSISASLHELADLLRAQGDLAGARARLEQSLVVDEKIHGTEEHPDVAASLHTLAGVLHAQGDFPGACAHLERSLAIKVKVYGTEEHPLVATSLHELARVCMAQGDFAGAGVHLERSLAIKVKVHGTEGHPSIAASLHQLAGVRIAQGNLSSARTLLERSRAILVKVHGTEEHPDVASSMTGLAAILEKEGEHEQAVAVYRRVLDIQARVFGTREHYKIAENEVSLGLLLLGMRRVEKACECLFHSYAVLRVQAPNHPMMGFLSEFVRRCAKP